MAKYKPRALFVGTYPEVGDALRELRPEWEFLPHVRDIDTLLEGLSNGTISNDIQVILIMDSFFDPRGEDPSFEQLVASMGPYCFLGIVNYNTHLTGHMREQITTAAYAMGEDSDNLHYYFIDPENPNPSIDQALNKYVATSSSDEVVAVLTGRVTSEERQAIIEQRSKDTSAASSSEFFEDDEDDDNPYLGKVVVFTSSKGGSGKSTVAITVASCLAYASENSVKEGLEDRPLKVCIVDFDVRDGQIGFLTGNAKPTVINLRLNGISRETIEATAIHDPKLKIDILLAPKRPRSVDDTPPEFYVELIQNLRKMYDYVILDTSVNYLDPLLEKVAYPTSDQIIFITDIVIQSIFSMTRWIQEVTKPKEQSGMGINKGKIGLVVNRFLKDVSMPGSKIEKATLGIPVLSVIPSNPKVMAHAANVQSMNTILRHPDLAPRILRIARAITNRNYNLSKNINA